LLAFDVNNISITLASTTDTVLLDRIGYRPILVFLLTLLLILGSLLKKRYVRQLSSWRVCGTVLDSSVSVPKISEIVDVSWGKKRPGS
jgi:hypothetical protein